MHNRLDQAVAEIEAQIAALAPQAVAVFFSCCAERLAPFYEHFTQLCKWGDAARFRSILDSVWQTFGQHPPSEAVGQEWLAQLDRFVPHADDFPNFEVTLAQDACICLDLAIRWATGVEYDRTTAAVEYAFEARRVIVCVRETGYLDLGSGPEGDEFFDHVVDDPLVAAEFEHQRADIATLQGADDLGKVAPVLRSRCWSHKANPSDIPAA